VQKDGKRILVLNKKQEKTNETLQIEKGKDISYMLKICFWMSMRCLFSTYPACADPNPYRNQCHLQGRDPIVVDKMSLFPKRTFQGVSQAQGQSHIAMPRFGPFTSSYIGKRYDMSSHDLYTWLLLILLYGSQMPVIL